MDTGDTRQYKVWGSSETEEEVDQFQVLEEKVDQLIETIKTLRAERDSYKERFEIQEEKIGDLSEQVEALKGRWTDPLESKFLTMKISSKVKRERNGCARLPIL